MDNRAIGVFDSGIGGLAVLRKLVKFFPEEDFIYLGDNGNVPYGDMPQEKIERLALNKINMLVSYGVKAIVVACNTVSVSLRDSCISGVPIFKLDPKAELLALAGERGCFLGTASTVRAIRQWDNSPVFDGVDFFCPRGLASELEENVICGKKLVLGDHLVTTAERYDFLYLGCTHYLFAADRIKEFYGVEKACDGVNTIIKKLFDHMEKFNMLAKNFALVNFVGEYSKKNREVFRKIASKN